DLDPARRALVRPHRADELQRALLGHVVAYREGRVADLVLDRDALDDARAVSEHEEGDLALHALVVEPAPERDLLADVLFQVLDVNVHGFEATSPGRGVSSQRQDPYN